MHNNYYFFRQVSARLRQILPGRIITECFTQNKEELIIRFERDYTSFFIRATLLPEFSCVTFPATFRRAKKNSVDLFAKMIGAVVVDIRQFENERCFAIELKDRQTLLFKMHGNRSNVLLFNSDNIAELFRTKIEGDHNLALDKLDRSIDWSKEAFLRHHETPSSLYFTFGKLVWQYLAELGYDNKTVEGRWELIRNVRAQLEKGEFFNIRNMGKPALSLVPVGQIRSTWEDPFKAVNEFYYDFTHTYAFEKEKNRLTSMLASRLQGGRNYLSKARSKFEELQKNSNYRMWADLIMANLHAIHPGSDHTTVSNFYNQNLPVTIKLKKDLSAQRNAEIYYTKAKNQQIELDHLSNAIGDKERDVLATEAELEKVTAAADSNALKDLRDFETSGAKDEKDPGSLPYHEFEHRGYRIWVGKNAQSNDVLTLKLSYKEDLWLHAKDVAGSHVLVKYQAGKNFPKDVIERAAQLAAYNSKRKGETLCPVSVTPKKYVRKRKGDPPGAVVVERETVIMVEPKL